MRLGTFLRARNADKRSGAKPDDRRPSKGRRAVLHASVLAAVVLGVIGQYGLALSGAEPARWWRSPAPAAEAVADVTPASAHELAAAFRRMDYRLDAVAVGDEVPRLRLDSIPADMADVTDGDARKALFLRAMLPLVLEANEAIAADRGRLQALAPRLEIGETLPPEDAAWLADLESRYEVRPGPGALPRLLRRVDAVPPSLALAQAALESGWGTSRLVRRANNLFGQTVDSGDPAAFANLAQAVNSYIRNLNTHPAYRDLRRARSLARRRGMTAGGTTLAGALTAYSELGREYTAAIRAMIRANALQRFDRARLRSSDSQEAGSI